MIRRKTRVSRKANQQLCTGGYLPSGSCHSAQQLVASSLTFYRCISVRYVSRKFLRCQRLHKSPFTHNISCNNTSESNQQSVKHLVRLGNTRPMYQENMDRIPVYLAIRSTQRGNRTSVWMSEMPSHHTYIISFIE